jgi:hypothetical protein
MDSQPAFGFKELMTHIVGDVAKAVYRRNGETQQDQVTRSQAAAHTIMGFQPRDGIEAILASRCLMFHELTVDSVRETLRGEPDTTRRATRANIVALDKAFGDNLTWLERYQSRPADGTREMEKAPMSTGAAETAELVAREPAETDTPAAQVPPAQQPAPEPSFAETELHLTASPEAVAACRANPEAMAALEAGDAERFARALGVDEPNGAFLLAADGPGSPFKATVMCRSETVAGSPDHRPNGVAAGDGHTGKTGSASRGR